VLADLARRLAAIDPERRGVGGIRFQLELVLLEAATRRAGPAAAVARQGPVATPSPAPSPEPPPANERPSRTERTARTEPEPPIARTEPSAPPVARTGPSAPPIARTEPSAPPIAPASPAIASASPPVAVPNAVNVVRPAATRRGRASADATPAPERLAATLSDDPQPITPSSNAASSPGPSAGGIDELRARWPEVVAILSQNPPIKPLIVACRPISVEDHLVTLGFPEDMAFLKIALERRGSILEEGIGRILGRTVIVKCVATNLEHVPAVAIEAESPDLISEARRIFADDLVDVGEVS
jgi:hypothetical protein